MAKIWNYLYNADRICVKNSLDSAELYINDQLQDRKTGISLQTELSGKLPSGESVKANLGGVLVMECTLFVDNVLQHQIK